MLCPARKTNRQRILNRLRVRKSRYGKTVHGSFHLGAEETRELTELIADINTAQIAIMDRLARRGEQPQGATQQLFYAFARLRALLAPGLEDADAERIEMNRPTNHAQMVKRVGQ